MYYSAQEKLPHSFAICICLILSIILVRVTVQFHSLTVGVIKFCVSVQTKRDIYWPESRIPECSLSWVNLWGFTSWPTSAASYVRGCAFFPGNPPSAPHSFMLRATNSNYLDDVPKAPACIQPHGNQWCKNPLVTADNVAER